MGLRTTIGFGQIIEETYDPNSKYFITRDRNRQIGKKEGEFVMLSWQTKLEG